MTDHATHTETDAMRHARHHDEAEWPSGIVRSVFADNEPPTRAEAERDERGW